MRERYTGELLKADAKVATGTFLNTTAEALLAANPTADDAKALGAAVFVGGSAMIIDGMRPLTHGFKRPEITDADFYTNLVAATGLGLGTFMTMGILDGRITSLAAAIATPWLFFEARNIRERRKFLSRKNSRL